MAVLRKFNQIGPGEGGRFPFIVAELKDINKALFEFLIIRDNPPSTPLGAAIDKGLAALRALPLADFERLLDGIPLEKSE